MMAPVLAAKQLELLNETIPGLSRVAVLWNPTNPGSAPQLREAEAAAGILGLRLQPVEARGLDELDGAFAAMTTAQADGLIVIVDANLLDHRARIAALAGKSRLPAEYGLREHVEAGGLMSYSANLAEMFRRAAYYVDRILKGAKPADLPVEQPTTFEFVINLKTAQALGLTIPQHVLLQATEVIQ
jgi:putative ABC transport system substrate-binding protein